jgi:hypothetical protein
MAAGIFAVSFIVIFAGDLPLTNQSGPTNVLRALACGEHLKRAYLTLIID